MSYESWQSQTIKTTGRTRPYLTGDGFPLDIRYLNNNVSDIYSLTTDLRYPGLKCFSVNDNKEFVYTITNTQYLELENEGIKEYHPELVHVGIVDPDNRPVKTYDENNEPTEYYTDAELLRNPTVLLGDGTVTYSNKSYNTIPEGAEGTLKTTDNKYYKYVWNGSEWVMFANSGSGSNTVILNFASDVNVGDDPNEPVYKTSICDLTSADISNAYKEAMGLDEQEEPASGSEANVVFTDKTSGTSFEYCRKYVYLNNEWLIVQGVQEYVITLPAYVDDEWYDGYNPKNGMVIEPNDDSANVDVMVASNKGTVDVIISHQFNSQYVDAFVFEKNETSENIDGGATPETSFLLTDLTS